jgi:hypothetical protein
MGHAIQPKSGPSGAKFAINLHRWAILKMLAIACNSNKKGGLFSRLQLRGKDLNLRPLGYEPKIALDATVISTT